MSIEIKRSCSLSILTLHTWAGTQGWLWQWMQSNSERTEAFLSQQGGEQNPACIACHKTGLTRANDEVNCTSNQRRNTVTIQSIPRGESHLAATYKQCHHTRKKTRHVIDYY